MKSFLLSVLTFIIGSLTVNATTYYVSASGNDANNGTSATTPWKSLSKVNTAALVAGDNILFNRGNVFYGSLSVTHSGAAGNPITFGAYGSGANPVITGFTSVSAWTNLGGNIWESTSAVSSLTSCNMVVVNGINYAMGRYPNTGYLTLQTHVAHTSITSSSLDATNWTGAEVVIRKNRSILDRSLITAQSGTTLTYTSGSTNDAQDNFGFFIQNDSRTLDQQNEWYYNTSTKKLQIYSPGSPVNVQVSTVDALVTANSNINYITFSSVDFQGSNTAIIKITNAGNFTLSGCNLNFSGTDAINSSTSPYLTIQNCTISNTNNNAVYAMGYEQTGKFYGPNIVISHNAITNTGLFPGMISKTANRNGFAIRAEGTASTIEYNSIINTGFNSISFDGNSTVIRNNFINTFCLILDDGGAIYTWNNSATPHVYTGRKIQNNIIVNGVGANAGTPTPPKSYVDGIYMDDGSQGVEISGNSIANVMRNGLFLHNAHEINMHDNTVFNANHIINFQQDNDLSRIQNNTIKNNILIAKASSQLTNYYRNYIAFPISSLGVADSNYYARPVDDNMTIMVTPTTGTVTQNLSQWQSYVGMDAHSKKSPKTITDTNDLRFEYNETGSNKTISLPYKYIDVKNVTYNGSITLAPYTSAVLIKNGASTGNQAPTANAGADQSITLPTSSVSLSGSGADVDGTISSYGWTKVSGPSAGTITSAGTGATTVTAMAQGVYKFALKVTDNGGASASDTVQVTVNDAVNVAPTVNAGADQSITLPTSSVSLSGSASDADGTISSYSWTKVSGPSAGTITSAGTAATTVTAMAQGVYKFALKVTDNDGATDFDTVQVTVNAAANVAPTANAGTDQSITLPTSSVSLSGSASDGDGTISSYSWTKVSGPSAGTITSAGAAATTVTAMAQGVYKFALKVTDNDGATDFDTVQVTVNAAANVAPTANAGTDQSITLPTSSVSLSGSASDGDGTISSYSWTKVSGPSAGTITSAGAAATTVTAMAQGVYKFALKVTDNDGATDFDTVQVTVNAAANVPPTVIAGTDQTIQLPTSSVSLSGSGSDVDGTITYSWTKVSGPASGTITSSSSAATTVTGMTQGVYQFQLKATDNNGATAVDAVQITVNAANVPPTVIAGADQTIQLPTSSVSLSGSGSDVDGTITYSWTKVSGPASGTITSSSSAATTVTGMTQGVYQFQLKVTDNNGATAVDAVQITVNAANVPPTVIAGADQTIQLPTSSVSLSGSGSDVDGTITYSWTKVSGPASGTITSSSSAATTVTGMTQGVYQFQLKVTDNNGATAVDAVQITVNAANIAPTVIAGADQTIQLPNNSVSLTGSGSDVDGTITYSWTKVSGPASGTITSSSSAATTVTGMTQGVYQFQLKVTDNNGATAIDAVQITVNAANVPPIVIAGADQTIQLPNNSVSLTGSGSDVDGTITYSWTKVSGPASGTITSSSSAATTVTGMTQGVYQFQLKVTDNNGATAVDAVQITVNAANVPPTVNAGTDQTIQLPTSSVSLSGSGSDVDGTITYSWTKVSGPASGTITNSSSAATTVTGMTQGVYQFQLKATDNNGATAVDAVQITVNAANVPPTVIAGADQTIQLPTSSVSLSGSGSDVDGTITYSWTKVSGPASGTITNSSSAATTVTGMTQGVYQFQLKATDNNGATAVDAVQITVNAANVPPTVIAGADQTIQLPTSSVSLSGSGSDVDGTITYSWTKVSGPASGTITSSSSAATTVTGMTQGVYQFQLKVTDNNGATAVDAVQITVNAANVPPTVIAGTDQTIQLPTSSVSLSGSGSDVDGTITYSWTKVSGPASGTITNASSAATTVTGMTQGVYQFQLKATDNNGATAVDAVQITVNAANVPPTVIAGADQSITLPINNVSLSGTASDADGTISSYSWTKVSGPASGTITSSSSTATTVTGMTQGVYKFALKVTDNGGAVAADTLQIIVNAAANMTPLANAGADQAIQLPTNSISLSGSGSDVDGTISFYSWSKLSGPVSGTITNSSSAATTVTGMTQGVYQFQLQVTDNSGATALDIVQITVIAANVPPTVNAGADQTIQLPVNSVSLSGSSSDVDGTISSYSWTKVSGPSAGTITSAGSIATTVTVMAQGVYKFQCKVTDNGGASAFDTVQVTVNAANVPPTANAGADQTIQLPVNGISLSGSGSDVDGTINYSWTKVSGPASGTITNSSSSATTVTGMTQGVYKFTLKVTDNGGASAFDTVQVTVNAANVPPAVNAGADQAIQSPANSVSLSGSASDVDGTIASYNWSKVSGPAAGTITNASSAATTVTGITQGIYQFALRVIDNNGAIAFDTMQVTVNSAANVPPTVNAGADQTIQLPTSTVSLSGSGTDADGSISSYSWTKISGPSAFNIMSATTALTDVSGLVQGVYQFALQVTDNNGAIAFDTVQVTVNAAANVPPTVSAGTDQSITLPTSMVSLSGSATDADGSISSYSWTKVSGPSAFNIMSATTALTDVSGLVQGVYQFALQVTDNNGAIALDTVQVTVNAVANISPTVNAGADKLITLPVNSMFLAGNGIDQDGTIVSYSWTKISGPPAYNIVSASSAVTNVKGLVQGVYQFGLQVTDNNGATAQDTVQVTVNPGANIPPVVNAGSDQSITLPVNTTSLAGSATDQDGTVASYNWTKISGPSSYSIVNASSPVTDIYGLTEGVYQFGLFVTDNKGATAIDTVQVTVNAAINLPPVAYAGADQSITLPVQNISPATASLSGSGTDTDGMISLYNWTKISGPTDVTITDAASASTTVAGLSQGVYQFQLEVTDNNGATAFDTVQITVNPSTDIAPTANAGGDLVITLPVNIASLAGSGNDQDGTIANYNWTKISGPSSYNIVNQASPVTDITGLTEGVYQFELTVTDNNGAIGSDTVQVTVKPAINVLPVADAGPNQTINLPRINTTLSGKGTDADGTISKYRWTKISGPIAIILSPNSKSTSVYWFLQGTYTFQLTVTDNSGATASDTMTVTVNPGRISLNFVNMVGQLSNGKVNLTWKTTGENNITGFDIERMAANSWEKIGYTQSSNLDITGNHYNFTDNAPVTGVNSYRLNMHDVHGKSVYSDTVKFEVKQNRNIVYQNIPNPFADNTTIRYDVTEKTLVKILISDGSGMPVTLLVNEVKEPGTYQVQWNAGNLPSGNYLYTIIVGNNVTTKRMLKIK